MSTLSALRLEVRTYLDGRCFLRRDRDARALFITDYPRCRADAMQAHENLVRAGFEVTQQNGLWRIDLAPARCAAFIAAVAPRPLPDSAPLPVLTLCRSLLSQGDVPPDRQPWPPLRSLLLHLEEGRLAPLVRDLSADIAVLKRTHAPLPSAAAYILIEEIQSGRFPAC